MSSKNTFALSHSKKKQKRSFIGSTFCDNNYSRYLFHQSQFVPFLKLFLCQNWSTFSTVQLLSLVLGWLCMSHLNEHRFKNIFQSCLNWLYTCTVKLESAMHFFQQCPYYSTLRICFTNDLNNWHKFRQTCSLKQYFILIQFLMEVTITKCLKHW